MNASRSLTLALLACTGLFAAGCTSTTTKKEPTFEIASRNAFIPTNRQAAAALIEQVKGKLVADQPLIVGTVVDINALDKSSTLGRLISEQVSASFSQAGFRMIEMKFRNSVYMKRSEGELLLTREISEVAKLHNAQAVIVGSYAVASEMVYVNLKIVQPNSNLVLGAYDYALPLDSNMRAMLTGSR